VLRRDAPAPARLQRWQSFRLCTVSVEEVAPAFATDGNCKQDLFHCAAEPWPGNRWDGVCGFEPQPFQDFNRRSIRSLHHWPSARIRTGMIVCRGRVTVEVTANSGTCSDAPKFSCSALRKEFAPGGSGSSSTQLIEDGPSTGARKHFRIPGTQRIVRYVFHDGRFSLRESGDYLS
jgi:hypothetical protein